MDNRMFCFQCEQTALCTGCTGKAGVCGKSADVANLQDELTGALIGLARATDGDTLATPNTWRLMVEGLFTTVTNVNFNEKTIRDLIDRVHEEKACLVPGCSGCTSRCGRNDDYDMRLLWSAQEDVRSLKSLILFGVRGMAAYAHHAMVLGYIDDEVNRFFGKALFAVGEDWGMDELLPIVMEVGEKNLQCMALLDRANTESYGTPVPVTVPLTVEKGPFIVITGHDLHDLKLLLEQTEGKGVNVYTHGEMLPAHGYPELKKYPHLKGNFGTAWQNQQKEFADIPAPVLFTTNCLMPPRPGYADRVFTTALVSYPEITHIGEDKDFTPVIEKALALGGYAENMVFTGINGGSTVVTGFGHGAVLSVAEQVIDEHLLDSVQLLGFRDNPYPYMAAADLYVCPSYVEGFSTVVSEAVVLETPVVTTDCSGMREILGDSEYGLITQNTEESLFEGLRTMLDKPEVYQYYQQRVRERAPFFYMEERLKAYEEILDQ